MRFAMPKQCGYNIENKLTPIDADKDCWNFMKRTIFDNLNSRLHLMYIDRYCSYYIIIIKMSL